MTFPVKMDQQTKPKVDAQTNLIKNVVCGSQNRNNSVESCHKKFVYRTKCFYSKHYNPQDIESSLVRPLDACVKSFKVSLKPSKNRLYSNVVKHGKKHYKGVKNAVHDLNDNPIIGMHSQCVKRDIGENKNNIKVSEDCIELHGNTDCRDRDSVKHLEHVHNVPGGGGGASDAEESDQKLLFDINSCGDDKFLHSLLFNGRHKRAEVPHNCTVCNQFLAQSQFPFGFVPLSDPVMPTCTDSGLFRASSFLELHEIVKMCGKPNLLGARIPLESQLNIPKWKVELKDYWDQQLLQFLEYGFPLGFNRSCKLGKYEIQLQISQRIYNYISRKKLNMGQSWVPLKKIPFQMVISHP